MSRVVLPLAFFGCEGLDYRSGNLGAPSSIAYGCLASAWTVADWLALWTSELSSGTAPNWIIVPR